MKKLWITIIVVVSILIVWGAFTLLGKVNDSSLSATSQTIEKIQHNTEPSDNLIEELLKSERHFVEVSFITVSIIITVVIILFSVSNFLISRSQLIDVEKKMEKKFEKKFESIGVGVIISSVDGLLLHALTLEQEKPEFSAALYDMILCQMLKCPMEYKTVQERIISALDGIHKLAPEVKVTLPDIMKKKLKQTLEKCSEHPLLKDKVKAIKEALEIDS